MLIQTDINELGDKNVKDHESLAKFKEETKALIDTRKIPNQKELEDAKAAVGRVIYATDFNLMIQKLNPQLQILPGGYPGAWQVRLLKGGESQYVTGYMNGPMPEYSFIVTDEHGLPANEVRGWRSALMALMKAGAITLKQIENEYKFGTANGTRSHLWNAQIQDKELR